MKKIYILTAVFALLTLSLNAQLKVNKNKVVAQPKSLTLLVIEHDIIGTLVMLLMIGS